MAHSGMLGRRQLLALIGSACLGGRRVAAAELAPGVSFHPGPVNGLLVKGAQSLLAVYGDPGRGARRAGTILFTHHRRETAGFGLQSVLRGAAAVVPARESNLFSDAPGTWRHFYEKTWRHDYAVQTSKFPVVSIQLAREVRGGDRIQWDGPEIEVLDTPGYTRGSVSYMIHASGGRVACVGDLIYGDGQILDVYSLQDAVAEVKIRGYHGFAARMAEVIASLEALKKLQPDVLVPAHGPLIDRPGESIDRLVSRLRELYRNRMFTAAENDYFTSDRSGFSMKRILGQPFTELMPRAEIVADAPPPWMCQASNSRIVISSSGAALLIDCGLPKALEEVRRLIAERTISRLEGIHITHYHDDHTDLADLASREFDCAVYTGREMRDILAEPARFRMPCLSHAPIRRLEFWPEGESRRWHEFRISRYSFPGQTLYHDAILVEKDGGERILLAGDSFSPAGLDDYCLLNRNIIAPGRGYLRCLELLQQLRPDMIVHQHLGPVFRFSDAQIDTMRRSLLRRLEILKELLPWEDPNFGIDEQWARLDPYGSAAKPGTTIELAATIFNHSASPRTFVVTPRCPTGWRGAVRPLSVRAAAGSEARAVFRVSVPEGARGLHLVTADVRFGRWDLREWMEALIEARY